MAMTKQTKTALLLLAAAAAAFFLLKKNNAEGGDNNGNTAVRPTGPTGDPYAERLEPENVPPVPVTIPTDAGPIYEAIEEHPLGTRPVLTPKPAPYSI